MGVVRQRAGDRRVLVFGVPAMCSASTKVRTAPPRQPRGATMILRHEERLDALAASLAFPGVAAFAAGCKYPFVFSAIGRSRSACWLRSAAVNSEPRSRSPPRRCAILAAPATSATTFYGDPVSPFLERFRSHPDLATNRVRRSSASRTSATRGQGLLFRWRWWCRDLRRDIPDARRWPPLWIRRRFDGPIARRWLAAAAAVTAVLLMFGQLAPRLLSRTLSLVRGRRHFERGCRVCEATADASARAAIGSCGGCGAGDGRCAGARRFQRDGPGPGDDENGLATRGEMDGRGFAGERHRPGQHALACAAAAAIRGSRRITARLARSRRHLRRFLNGNGVSRDRYDLAASPPFCASSCCAADYRSRSNPSRVPPGIPCRKPAYPQRRRDRLTLRKGVVLDRIW